MAEEYRTPKLVGNKVPMNNLVMPKQHYRAWKQANEAGLSVGEYLGALVDRDAGLPNKLDDIRQGVLPIYGT